MSPNTAALPETAAAAGMPEWLELYDPQTSRVVYANTVTGQCSWARPDSSIAARDPNGEWWELVDEETGVPYYYNSTTGATEWDPPEYATIVPFHALLTSSVGKRLSIVVSNRGSMAFTSEHVDMLTRKASRASLRSADGHVSRKNSIAASGSRHRRKASAATGPEHVDANSAGAEPADAGISEPEQSALPVPGASATASALPAVSGQSPANSAQSPADSAQSLGDCDGDSYGGRLSSLTDAQHRLESGTRPAAAASPSTKEQRRLSNQRHSQSETALETLKEALCTGGAAGAHDESEEDSCAADTCLGHHADYRVPASATVEYFRSSEQAPRAENASGRPRNYSEQPRYGTVGPTRDYSEQPHYGTVGPTRMSNLDYCPHDSASSVMLHSHRNRSMPSISADGRLHGMRAFASAQFAAQKRGFLRRKVPLEEMVSYTSEAITRPLMNLPRELTRDAVRSFRIIQRHMGNTDADVPAAERFAEVLWLANRGIRHQLLRDEVLCQLAKQVTGNPSAGAAERGWALLGVLLYAFRPTQLLLPHLEAFVGAAPVPTLALRRFLRLQLARVKRTGSRTAELSARELRLALTVPERPLVFGGALDDIMADPELTSRHSGLPRVLEQLTALIGALGGDRAEGLFRVPGDADAVAMARLQIEAGHPDFSRIHDPNVPASLLKEWLRDLADPLIPEPLYEACMATPGDAQAVSAVLEMVPESSQRVIRYLVEFLVYLLQPAVQARTKMDCSSLALVFGPSFLRNQVSDLKDVFAGSSGEQSFVQALIEHFRSGDASFK
ncbi:hypothetical protein GGF42_004530 [Coemansia sp. RSA 2424]|nr:hypothetical protein GGF42_004530 [Coemansia sp. RSA 2424]